MARWPGGTDRGIFLPGLAGFSADQAGFFASSVTASYHRHYLAIDTERPLKSRTNLVIAVLAAAVLAVIAVKSLTRQPAQFVSKPSVANCTPEAIKQVTDALERSVLSSNCAKQKKTDKDQSAMP
ncbi:entry exclusion lipoprotein TrbK [Duganella sp. Root1480D1]|uniref:entry exclusion lipoprotein TrbK n=1 Tax=Duganella sp. Root1480D1 TaxID=1736471 RepID=UPI00070E384E|nr:entry exclusion lipoprotein TrbK [Duganella sp. Root1480D1]KQZ26796.1 hypothetical protein ASD58_14490 [Duganella sp. Root1480D1]